MDINRLLRKSDLTDLLDKSAGLKSSKTGHFHASLDPRFAPYNDYITTLQLGEVDCDIPFRGESRIWPH
jgi:hypothetical protein